MRSNFQREKILVGHYVRWFGGPWQELSIITGYLWSITERSVQRKAYMTYPAGD